MALDSTARESNFKDSIKKYFVDNLETTEGVPVTFDKGLSSPDLEDRTVEKWVAVNWGPMQRGTMSAASLAVHMCTRGDNEGFKLAQLSDKVMGYLSDENSTDGYKRIPFYQSHHSAPWTQIGMLLVTEVFESAELEADDETKYKTFDVQIRFASKI